MKSASSREYRFAWKDLGDIEGGRPNLGNLMPVGIYRLTQYTVREAIANQLGDEAASRILRQAGWMAGREFCLNMLDRELDFPAFMAQLQQVMRTQLIGVLRIESADLEADTFTLTLSEDLDCSGLAVSGSPVCTFDEGFIAGIFHAYTGRDFTAIEVDCWSTGDRTCRFEIKPEPALP